MVGSLDLSDQYKVSVLDRTISAVRNSDAALYKKQSITEKPITSIILPAILYIVI